MRVTPLGPGSLADKRRVEQVRAPVLGSRVGSRPVAMALVFFFLQAEDGIRDKLVTGVQTCALPICADHDHGAVGISAQLLGGADRFAVYAYLVPHLGGGGAGQTAFFDGSRGYVSKKGTWLAVEIGRASCRERV